MRLSAVQSSRLLQFRSFLKPSRAAQPCPYPPTPSRPIDRDYTLEHKYTRTEGRIYLSGVQALVRLPLMQQMRDRAAGINTRRFHLRLSRLAARRLRSRAVEGEEAPQGVEHRVHAGPQRRSRRDDGLGHAAGEPVSRREVRRRVRDVVRQGSGRRSLRRCVQARQRGRHVEARRRARARGRRSRVPLVDAAARIGARIRLGDDAGAESGRRAGHPRHGPARLGDVALHRALGRLQDDRGNGRIERERQRQSASARHRACRPISRCRPAVSTSAGPIRRSIRKCVCTGTRCRPRSRSRARTASIAS